MCEYWFVHHPFRETNEKLKLKDGKKIYFDNLTRNQDPYIWSKRFLYSFCNISKSNKVYDLVKPGDYIFFVTTEKNNEGILDMFCDLVFKVDQKQKWLTAFPFKKNHVGDMVTDLEFDNHYRWWIDHPKTVNNANKRTTFIATENSFQPQYANGKGIVSIWPIMKKSRSINSDFLRRVSEGKKKPKGQVCGSNIICLKQDEKKIGVELLSHFEGKTIVKIRTKEIKFSLEQYKQKMANMEDKNNRKWMKYEPVVNCEINKNCKVFFIAQAPGENEVIKGKPLVGSRDGRTAGYILNDILNQLKLKRKDCSFGNTYNKLPGKKINLRDEAPTKEEQRNNSDNLYDCIIESQTPCIVTLGKTSKEHLLWMVHQKEYSKLKGIKIIHCNYPNVYSKKIYWSNYKSC